MTNGIYEESKPMGDTRFLEHRRINPKVAKAWQGVLTDNFLSDLTWDVALLLGYERPDADALQPDSTHHLEQQPAVRSRRELLEQHRQRRMRLRKER
jgi:hypothetical protein